ncbi:hypothetical protein BACCOPRO_01693 [Phocaeicola coprophilus DSM 18228 = JCM 13818]|uniref:Uncharacterized protein n=1 Tax=Phocaeicola coprophilus DSM 18228 = JCM 13818 TaxID=547042 RepID=S0FCS6_9BACT|nr:hypothetical protein BACCOPRO_01693 [Phocaeicola coprophilus DSM 18228 = JCM 13818]
MSVAKHPCEPCFQPSLHIVSLLLLKKSAAKVSPFDHFTKKQKEKLCF